MQDMQEARNILQPNIMSLKNIFVIYIGIMCG
jgi:hypothetical protein